MKLTTIIFMTFVLFTTITSGQVKFENTEILFDSIYSGQKIIKTITFKNISANPIKVNNIKTTCGCLSSKWRNIEILPNQQDSIELIFESNGKIGLQNKTVKIFFDNDSLQKISLKGFVKPSLINFTVNTPLLKLIENKKNYKFEITNTGDSLIYIDQLNIDTLFISANIDKKKLLKNEKAIITVTIKNEIIQLKEEPIQFFEMQAHIKDCCGLTETFTTFTINNE